MLHLLIGTDWIGVREEILKRIAADVAGERGNRILMVPELTSHDSERRLCAAAGDTASRFAEVLTFTRLSRRVSDRMGGGCRECLDDGGRIVAMAAAAMQLTGQLKTYACVLTQPEFLKQMVDAVDEFKRCRITSEDLHQASLQAEGTLAQKLEELSLLLGTYDGICQQGKRDPRDRETLLLEQLQDCDFAREHVFYIDGFPDFTRQHMAILEHLIRFSPDVTIGINCDEIGTAALAFEKAGDTASQLFRMAKDMGVKVTVEKLPGREDELGHACRALFQGPIPTIAEGSVHALRCRSIYEEVTVAAERIHALVRRGSRYRDIAIVCGDMGAYEGELALQFDRFHIPLYRTGTEDILDKTVIVTVLSALEAALLGMENHSVLRYLKSVLSPLDPELTDRVENYAVLWGIRGSGWTKPWEKHPDGLNEPWTDSAQRRLQVLEDARVLAVTPLVRLREQFMRAKDLASQVEAVAVFLEQIGLCRRLETLATEMDEAKDNRSAQILNQLWEILLAALEQLHDVLGRTIWEPDTFIRLFKLLLSQYDVGTIPPVLDAVSAGSVSAMRCHQVEHLFVLGAEEGVLPGYAGSSGLLSDQERVTLRQMGIPLTGGAMEGVQAEFAEIYGVFCCARKTITVSSCSGQPSYLYRRLCDMAGADEEAVPRLGAALADAGEAGGYLAAFHAEEDADRLGIGAEYRRVSRAASHQLGRISQENIRRIYGTGLKLSASQVDRQAECRMSYFLKYGLRAHERKEATIDPAEFGTYVHYVLENTARAVMEQGGFHQVSLEQTMEIAASFSDDYADAHFAQVDTARIGYLFRRNRRELEMVVQELWQELKHSNFQPKDFELKFGDDGTMPAITIASGAMDAALRGFVDRVDIWHEDGRNYFRVVDYKTGKKDFDYCDVFNAVGLQMLLYLFALEEGGFGIGAGVQYFPARVPLMSADGKLTDGEADALRRKEWKRKGLLLKDEQVLDAMDDAGWQRLCAARKKDGTISGDLADREQLRILRQYIYGILGRMVDDIASGNVQPNPYTRGTSHDACAFCPYGAVCAGDKEKYRRNYKVMTQEQFWDEVSREVKRHG